MTGDRLWKKIFGRRQRTHDLPAMRDKLERLRALVDGNNRVLELLGDAGEKLGGEYIFDRQYLITLSGELEASVRSVVHNLNAITGNRYPELQDVLERIVDEIRAMLESRVAAPKGELVIPIDRVDEESVDLAGGKMARLGEIRKRLHCRIPDGFVVSAYACQRFLEKAGIEPSLEQERSGREEIQHVSLSDLSAGLCAQVSGTVLDRRLMRAIRRGLAGLKRKGPLGSLAVRSSALGEDGELSFAGQYQTILGVSPDRVPSAYKEVLRSLYSLDVMRYRQAAGLDPVRGLMAVGCLCMVEARASGVIYTLDPQDPGREVVLVAAAKGLGTTVVEGSGAVDRFELSREPPHEVVSRSLGRKEAKFVVEPGRGICKVAVAESDQKTPAVTDAELRELATAALSIERYMKCAQDIEWALNMDGQLFILQTRPLAVSRHEAPVSVDVDELMQKYPVLMRNQGEVACRGIGVGRVHLATHDDHDLDTLPEDAVLVARSSSPRLAAVMSRASAVLTDVGTPTGHLAAIAREFRVPTIVDTERATSLLKNGMEVTVDAEENVVYQGIASELLHYQLLRSSSYAEAAEFRLLRRMLKKIAPLNLKDPQSPGFSVQNCATYHDIIRFAHEKAIDQVTQGHWMRPSRGGPYIRRLELEIPLDLVLIDLGGGFLARRDADSVSIHDLTSTPLVALLEGLTTPGAWPTEPADMDLNGFMSSATRSGLTTGLMTSGPQQNLAIVSGCYLHLSLRLGYHFNIVDCYLTDTRNDNFIYFRFTGGVTEMARRSRRARLLKEILEKHDFVVEGKGDLVIGRIKKISGNAMVERLRMIGRLIGFTRQLDILLRDDTIVERCVNSFLKGEYSPFE